MKRNFPLIFILILLITTTLNAQSEELSDVIQPSNLIEGLMRTIEDPSFTNPNSVVEKPAIEVRVGILDDVVINPSIWFTYEIKLKVNTLNLITNTENPATSEVLKIEYSPFGNVGNFKDLDLKRFNNAQGLKIYVEDITIIDRNTNNPINISNPGNVYLELRFLSNRYRRLSTVLPNITTKFFNYNENGEFEVSNTSSSEAKEVEFNWNPITGAKYYDLEWTWIDNYPTNVGSQALDESDINLSLRTFENNSTRVRIENTSYRIPLVYANGYLVYRIRAVGFRADDYSGNLDFTNTSKLYFGEWTSSPIDEETKVSDWNDHFPTFSHENNKNWQFQASFAEDGKKKEVVSYFDGTLRNRQTVTKINTDNSAIVGEVIYDNQGRAAIEVLPSPTKISALQFHEKFNLNLNNEIYTHYDFDWSDPNSLDCDLGVSTSGMSDISGASLYYSDNLDLKTEPKDYFVPHANNYPFSQIQYTDDNTGRIKRKSGVGNNHQLGSGHEMKYYYGTPNQPELNRLFGYKVGFSRFYKKNTVIDPNGQISLSYLDPQGRTIATALTGNSPNNLEALSEAISNPQTMASIDLLSKINSDDPDTDIDRNERFNSQAFNPFLDGLRYTGNHFAINDNDQFILSYKAKISDVLLCDTYYPFVYNLNLSILNECGDEISTDLNSGSPSSIVNTIIGTNEPSTTNQTDEYSKTITTTQGLLKQGNYTINKTLTVNEDIFNEYLEDYMLSDCILPKAYFELHLIDDSCKITEQDCITLRAYANATAYAVDEIDVINQHLVANNLPVLTSEKEDQYMEAFIAIYDNKIISCDLLDEYNEEDDSGTYTYTDNCDIATLRLLQDFKPGEQYAIYEQENSSGQMEAIEDQFSIFYGCNNVNDETCVSSGNSFLPSYDSSLELPIWKHPKDLSGAPTIYYNDDAFLEEAYVDVKVEVDENGEFVVDNGDYIYSLEVDVEFIDDYLIGGIPRVDQEYHLINDEGKKVRPHHLAKEEDFINVWNDKWAHSLLFYHPEVGYSSYFKAICTNLGDNTSNPIQLSSTAFDDYIKSLSAADILNDSSLEAILDDPLALLLIDPFFNITYNVEQDAFYGITTIDSNNTGSNTITLDGSTYDFNNEKDARNALMKYALEHDLDGLGLPMWQHAYRLYNCGDITLFECEAPDSIGDIMTDLTPEEEEAYWASYRATYLSMKEKVIYIFSNIFAEQNGFNNSCIENLNSNPFAVINNYPSQLVTDIIESFYINTVTTGVCYNNGNAYEIKSRRYLPFDVVLGEDSGNPDALNNLIDSNDYDYWQFTGLCPTAVDMLYFIKGFFADVNKNDAFPIENGSGNQTAYNNVQYLTPDLYTALGGTVTIEDNDDQPLLGSTNGGIKIYTNGASAANSGDLAIRIGDDYDTDDISTNGDDETCAIYINDTDSDDTNYNWLDYGVQWSITNILDFVYTGTTQGQQTFTFLAKVSLSGDPDNIREVVFSGSSCANVANCGTDGSQAGNDEYDFIPVAGECEIRHIGMTILAPDKGDNWTPNHSTTYTDSPVDQGQRHDLIQGIADFVDNIYQDNVLFTSFHDQASNPFVKVERNLTNFIGGYDSYIMNISTNELRRQPQVDVTEDSTHGGYIMQSQNDNYNNTFRNIIENIPSNITEPIDVMYFVLLSDKVYDINGVIQSYNSFKNNPLIKKVFFIIPRIPSNVVPPMSNRSAYFEDVENWDPYEHNWTPYEFIELLIGDTPIEYNGITNTTLNSDYFAFNLTDLDESHPKLSYEPTVTHDFPELTTFLTNSYNEVFNQSTEVSSTDPCNPCTPIIPPTTSCNEAWDIYESGLGNDSNITNYSDLIPGLDLRDYEWLDEDKFCELNYKYSIEHYELYVSSVMNARDPSNPGINNAYYIEFPNFTSHDLGYGHPSTADAIQQYANYLLDYQDYVDYHSDIVNGGPEPTTEVSVPLNFLNFVAEEYIDMSGVCPRATLQINTPEIDVVDDCESFLTNLQNTYQNDLYEQYLEEQREYFRNEYLNAAMNSLVENLDLSYDDKEYQYTLYYYDQAGNLMQTVPPKGVYRLNSADHNQINNLRFNDGMSTNNSVNPIHSLKTRYKYNSLNQLVYQNTPDGGETRFAYDKLGRIVMSQNAKQAIPVNGFFQEVVEYPTFVNKIGVSTSGNDIESIVSGPWVAGASSQELIYDNGYIEWELLSPASMNMDIAVGLSYSDNDTTAEDIDYRLYQSPGSAQKLVGYDDFGTPQTVDQWQVGQKLRIERISGHIKFYVDNNFVHLMTDVDPTSPLRFDCAFNGIQPKAIRNIKIVNTWKTLESFSYTSYDDLGRINEAGQLKVPNNYYEINNEGRLIYTSNGNLVNDVNEFSFPNNISKVREEVTLTTYDTQSITNILPVFEDYNKFNNRNRVTAVLYYENYPDPFQITNYDNGLFYSYDIHGNVKELVTDIKDPRLEMMWQNLKKVSYEYDLISGNVNKVFYQKGYKDQFIHQYFYDADNRITQVKTSKDGIIWENEAEYDYYKHGPLARVLIGNKKVQGLDYAYTIQGWLKGVNSEKIDAEDDMGNDGYYGDHFKVAKDAFGFSLRYYNGDYEANEGARVSNLTGFMEISNRNLYNGNIKQMVTSLRGLNEEKLSSLSNLYKYDQLNRISSSYNQTIMELNSNNNFDTNNAGYDTQYTYDKNGNIKTLRRDAFGVNMDNFENYELYDNTNQLKHIKETANPSNFDIDIDEQNSENYVYDAIGQLVYDDSEQLKIAWTVSGKVKAIGGNKDIKFTYDGLGNRLSKTEVKKGGNSTTTYYLRDAQGNPLAVNNLNSFPSNNFLNWNTRYSLKEHNIYGSSRLGLQEYAAKRKENLLATLNYTDKELKKFRSQQQNIIDQSNTLLCENCAYSFNETDNSTGSIIDNLLDINLNTSNTFSFNTIISPLNNFQINTEELILELGESPFGTPSQGLNKIFLYLERNSDGTDFRYLPILKLVNNQVSPSILTTFTLTNPNDVTISSIDSLQDIFYTVEVTPSNELIVNLSLNGNQFSTSDNSLSMVSEQSNILSQFGSHISNNNFRMCNLSYNFDGVSRNFNFELKEQNPSDEFNSNTVELILTNLNESLWIEGGCGVDNDYDNDTVLDVYEDGNSGVDPSQDEDGDGILNYLDQDDPNVPVFVDNNNDGVNDVYDTDGDGIANWMDEDDDNDGILTKYEDADQNGSVLNDDTDNNWVPNYLDPDDDGDSIPTQNENADPNDDNEPSDAVDFDGDEIPNYLDNDDDDDTVLTIDEYLDGQDFDGDGALNYLDTDDDNDTVPTAFENTFPGDEYLLDTDGDGDPNFLDIDDDNDGYITQEEDDNFNNNPIDDDEDGDGHPDFLDAEDLNPNVPGPINMSYHYNLVGDKRYELSNHLGNVISVISDRKLPAFNIGKEWYGSKSFKDYWNPYNKSSLSVDEHTLHVKCHEPESGAYGKYVLDSGLTYSVQMDIGKENFMANLVFEILDPSGDPIYTQTVLESTTIGTQFTTNQSGTYVLLIYVDESFTQTEEFTISNLIIADVTGIAHDTNQIDLFGTFVPDVFAYNDYYPFGMLMPKRHDSEGNYRYGFNGMEADDEIKGGGNSYTSYFRQYDSRIGRWLSLDPEMENFPNQSPYNGFDNSPIKLSDPHGNCTTCPKPEQDGTEEGQISSTEGELYMGQRPIKTWWWHEGTDYTEKGWYSKEDYEYTQLDYENGQILLPREEKSLLNKLLTGNTRQRYIDITNDKVVEIKGGEGVYGIPVDEDGYMIGKLSYYFSKEPVALEVPWYIGGPSKKAGSVYAVGKGYKLGANFLFNSRGLAKAYLKRIILKLPKSQKPVKQWTVGADKTKKGLPNYVYSESATDHGKFWLYKTDDGYKVIVNHIKDGKNHFHIGVPKDANAIGNGADAAAKYFQTNRYKKIEEVNHAWFD
ncbi:RHS repeat-associated core domain-containing protein [Psychroserpens mesophilus]|uniref:RHS repeat-associated core domain-containing protein n=1 Tax=Psychroserpens mesophilus TaxID=325473 RepID=UPI00058D2F2B|nr:RHS repeat-associated core domain-containing protein [Psychroserpens mesophilus]